MTEVQETELPGVGVRYEFTIRGGRRLGVVAHWSGRRELFVSTPDDPDATVQVLELSEEESQTLADLLGASRVAEHLTTLQQRIKGLAIDWLPVDSDSPYAGASIGDARIRTRTGVSVVAIVRGDETIPAPGPDTRMEPGDQLVVVGTIRGIEAVVELLHHG